MSEVIVRQAGAITLKKDDDGLKVLLIRSKKNPEHRIFPKGHVEDGEEEKSTAVRELHEEAGIVGTIIDKIGTVSYVMNDKRYSVCYYSLSYTETSSDGEPGREPVWFTIDEAMNILSFEDLKKLLERAIVLFE